MEPDNTPLEGETPKHIAKVTPSQKVWFEDYKVGPVTNRKWSYISYKMAENKRRTLLIFTLVIGVFSKTQL